MTADTPVAEDLRERIFRDVAGIRVAAVITAEAEGILSGVDQARQAATELGLTFTAAVNARERAHTGEEIVRLMGSPMHITQAEDVILGALSKFSGIASAAHLACRRAGGRCRLVSGGAKKMPVEIKGAIRRAVLDGGMHVRMLEQPFVYLDKNYVRIFRGISGALSAVAGLGRKTVIQIRGETSPIAEEALEAAQQGASVIMIDTGRIDHVRAVSAALKERGLRDRVEIAFSGGITIDRIDTVVREDIDAVDIGYAMLDAPCLPLRMDVIEVGGA